MLTPKPSGLVTADGAAGPTALATAWHRLPMVLRSRRLPAVELAVDVVRVGAFVQPRRPPPVVPTEVGRSPRVDDRAEAAAAQLCSRQPDS